MRLASGDPLIRMNGLMQRGAMVLVLLSLPGTVRAGAVQITNDVPLAFGSLISGATPGTITITSSGTTSTTGGVIAFGAGAAAASFTISIEKGNPNYSIVLPSSANLIGTGAPMLVDGFESTPGNGGHVRPPTGFQDMTLGATLHVGANQAAGTYSGTFNITVTSP